MPLMPTVISLNDRWDLSSGAAYNGATALYIASQDGRASVVEHLIAAGAVIDPLIEEDMTPLFTAAQNGPLAVVEMLVAAGANLETTTEQDATPLMIAAELGHADIVKTLLAIGANPRGTGGRHLPVKVARKKGHRRIVKILSKPLSPADRAAVVARINEFESSNKKRDATRSSHRRVHPPMLCLLHPKLRRQSTFFHLNLNLIQNVVVQKNRWWMIFLVRTTLTSLKGLPSKQTKIPSICQWTIKQT